MIPKQKRRHSGGRGRKVDGGFQSNGSIPPEETGKAASREEGSQPRMIRLREVVRRTGLSKSTIYSLIAKGTFPRGVPLARRVVGWIESEVTDWIGERIAEAGPR